VLGILTLDTAFPRIRGDVGCAATFDFPVRYATPKGAVPELVVHRRDETMLPAFVAAAQALTAALAVPVLTSSLLQAGTVARTLPRGQRVGIVTYSAADLTPELLAAAGVPAYSPVEGVDPAGTFFRTIRHGAAELDEAAMAADVVAAARRLVGAHRDVGAIVLECANMPPYRAEVEAAAGVPVYDAAQLVAWFHAGLAGTRPHRSRRDLW